jgi:deoxycytidylate deaminase
VVGLLIGIEYTLALSEGIAMSTDDLFNRAALSMVPDPEHSPTIFDKKSPGEKRLTGYKITENPDHLGMLYSMTAAARALHPEVRVGAVAYDRFTGQFGPPACNHLTNEASIVGFTPFMMMNPLDKRFTECAEIRAIRQTMFLMFENGEIRGVHNRRDRDWTMYTTRLPCKRCRGFVAGARPLEVVVHKQTTDWLLANKRGYKAELEDTTLFFEDRQVRVRHVDLPLDFMTRLFAEVAMEMPYGVPKKRVWRSEFKRRHPHLKFNR